MTVAAAVERELGELERRDPELARSALAASVRALAAALDDAANSLTSRVAAAKEMREALDRLRELAPVAVEGDGVSEIQDRARLKLAGGGS